MASDPEGMTRLFYDRIIHAIASMLLTSIRTQITRSISSHIETSTLSEDRICKDDSGLLTCELDFVSIGNNFTKAALERRKQMFSSIVSNLQWKNLRLENGMIEKNHDLMTPSGTSTGSYVQLCQHRSWVVYKEYP